MTALARAVAYLAADPAYDDFLLAGRLLQWQIATGIGDADLMRRLGIADADGLDGLDGLTRLRTCRLPRGETHMWQIAEFVGASVDALGGLLREVIG